MTDTATATPSPQSSLNLGLIGNSRTGALIDPQAGIVWWCHPRLDGDPVCSALLSGEAGESALERMARGLREERPDDPDETLMGVLQQIDLRAAVELAKAEVRRTAT
jgi:hypothetical protein